MSGWWIQSRFAAGRGGKPFSSLSRTSAGNAAERLTFNERFKCENDGTFYQEPEPRLFSSTIRTAHVPVARDLATPSISISSGCAGSGQIAGRRGHRAMDQAAISRAFPGREKMGEGTRHSDECAMASTDRRTASAYSGRRSRNRFQRRQRFFHMVGAQEIQAACSSIP